MERVVQQQRHVPWRNPYGAAAPAAAACASSPIRPPPPGGAAAAARPPRGRCLPQDLFVRAVPLRPPGAAACPTPHDFRRPERAAAARARRTGRLGRRRGHAICTALRSMARPRSLPQLQPQHTGRDPARRPRMRSEIDLADRIPLIRYPDWPSAQKCISLGLRSASLQ
jgi:hypothetical protein